MAILPVQGVRHSLDELQLWSFWSDVELDDMNVKIEVIAKELRQRLDLYYNQTSQSIFYND